MLTSYQTLLGGLTAALCAAGMVYANDSEGFLPNVDESSQTPSVEISYRGSGRLEDHSESDDRAQSKSNLTAHRGSGRVQPQRL